MMLVGSGTFRSPVFRSSERNFRSRERKFPGTFVPGSECSREHSFHGAIIPGSELCTSNYKLYITHNEDSFYSLQFVNWALQ